MTHLEKTRVQWLTRVAIDVQHPLRVAMTCAILAAVTGSCSDTTGSKQHPIPASLEVVAGDAQEGTVGTELGHPLVARVLDERGKPIPGQVVNFRVTAGGGSVFAGSALTNKDGVAQERWTLGTSTADSQKVEVRAVDSNTGAPIVLGVFRATPRPGAPDTVRTISGDRQSAVVGAALPESLLVRVADRYGNPVPGVTVTWTAPQDAGTLSRSSDVTTASGHASTEFTVGTRTGAYVVTAAAGERTADFSVNVMAAAPTMIVIYEGDGQTATIMSKVAVDPAVRVLDAHGNPVWGAVVSFSLTDNRYGFISATSVAADAAGIARVRWILGSKAGANTLRASVADLPAVTLNATGIAGPAASLTKIAGDGQTAPPGSAVPVPPAVRVADAYGNLIAGARVPFTVAAGSGSVTGGAAATDVNGIATVGSWTLGATRGTNVLTASVDGYDGLIVANFTAAAAEQSPNVTVSIIQPAADPFSNVAYGDQLRVQVAVTSRYAIASIRAAAGAAQADLSFSTTSGRWEGTLALQGEPRGKLELVVTARDINGAVTDAFRTFVHDRPPTLVVHAPPDGSVARPTIDFSASCEDDDPAGCSGLFVSTNGIEGFAWGTSQVTGTASLAKYNGQRVVLDFAATDSRGQTVRVSRAYFVESSAYLREIVSADGDVIDVQGDKFLFRDASGRLRLQSLSSGATEVIPVDTNGVRWLSGFITSTGAIIDARTSDFGSSGQAFEWRSGRLLTLGAINPVASMSISGNYALFANGAILTRRDLAAGTSATVTSSAGNSGFNPDHSVAPNGDVVYWDSGTYDVFRYRGGITTPLTADDDRVYWNTSAVTDGLNVVYRKQSVCCNPQTYRIVLHDGTGETILAPDRSLKPVPNADYAVNAGWTAFTKLDDAGGLQIWTRSPNGTLRQVWFAGNKGRIEALGGDGTVIFVIGERRYFAAPDGAPRDILSTLGTIRWRDGRFVLFIGRTAFEIAL